MECFFIDLLDAWTICFDNEINIKIQSTDFPKISNDSHIQSWIRIWSGGFKHVLHIFIISWWGYDLFEESMQGNKEIVETIKFICF